ncbi:MAG: hypothetical protein ACE5JC_10260 [Candidatus Zixiibacteriota bacterium]
MGSKTGERSREITCYNEPPSKEVLDMYWWVWLFGFWFMFILVLLAFLTGTATY